MNYQKFRTLAIFGLLIFICLPGIAPGHSTVGSSRGAAQKIQLIYVYDALCGWCFGFSPVMRQLEKEFSSQLDIEVLSGGLKFDKAVGTINQVAPFIKTAYKDVERSCGVKFGDAFVQGPLKRGTMMLNSLPPAIAMQVVKEKRPELSLPFSRQLHKMMYTDGVDPEQMGSYARYAQAIGFDTTQFTKKMRTPIYEQKARAEFQRSSQLGVTGFPALFVVKNGRPEWVVSGFVSYDVLMERLRPYIRK